MLSPLKSTLTTTAMAAVLLVSFSSLASGQGVAPPSYTATAVHQRPGAEVSNGVVIKSGANMRLEYTEAGRNVVQIIRRAEGLVYFLDPSQKTYMEISGEPSTDPNGVGYMPPCKEGDGHTVCKFAGNEMISGINAELWEIGQPGQDQTTKVLWDGARHRALRQAYPDGSVMKMAFRAMETLAGRTTEHWTITIEVPGQPAQSGEWFYDPELRVEVREVMPGGEVRSLENIQVGPVNAALFEVPAGYTRLDMPPQPPVREGGN